jgi:hypothetical protein
MNLSQIKQEWTLHGQIKKQHTVNLLQFAKKYKPCTFQLQQQTTAANNALHIIRNITSKNVSIFVNQIQIKVCTLHKIILILFKACQMHSCHVSFKQEYTSNNNYYVLLQISQ